MTVRRALRPSERWSALVFLCSATVAALAAGEPFMLAGSGDESVSSPLAHVAPVATHAGPFLAGPAFDPLRRPVAGAAGLFAEPAPSDVAAPPPPLRLAGIVVEGAAPKAMFAGVETWLGVGSTIDGWTLAAVEPRRVILRQGEETKVLDFTDAFR